MTIVLQNGVLHCSVCNSTDLGTYKMESNEWDVFLPFGCPTPTICKERTAKLCGLTDKHDRH